MTINWRHSMNEHQMRRNTSVTKHINEPHRSTCSPAFSSASPFDWNREKTFRFLLIVFHSYYCTAFYSRLKIKPKSDAETHEGISFVFASQSARWWIFDFHLRSVEAMGMMKMNCTTAASACQSSLKVSERGGKLIATNQRIISRNQVLMAPLLPSINLNHNFLHQPNGDAQWRKQTEISVKMSASIIFIYRPSA